MTFRCIGRNTVRDLFTSSIIDFTWNIMTFKIQPVSKVMTDNGSNQDFVDSFEMVTFKCQQLMTFIHSELL